MRSRPEPSRRRPGAAVPAAILTLATAAVAVATAPDDVPAPKDGEGATSKQVAPLSSASNSTTRGPSRAIPWSRR